MKMRHIIPLALVAFAGLSLGAGCPTVPKIEDRVVELALGASTTVSIPAAGVVNVYNQDAPYDLALDFNLNKTLSDAGVDLADAKDIKLSGISYRVTVPDPNSGRTITGATVRAQRPPGTSQLLISSFSQNVDAVSGWTKAPLDSAGVTVINGLLTDMLASAKSGTPVANSLINYHVNGTSTPTGLSTSFTWEIRFDLTIVGSITVKVLN